MAEKVSYPVIDTVRWWALRKQFKTKSIPGSVDIQYLTTVLGIQAGSAQNILSPLKKIGLIDQDGKPTDRVRRWGTTKSIQQFAKKFGKTFIHPHSLTFFLTRI